MSQTKPLGLSSSPHVRSPLSTGIVMLDVLLALLPATVVGVVVHGLPALLVIVLAVAASVLTELLFDLITRRPITVKDGSAAVTGLLLALCLPPYVPFYIPILGGVFGILVVKCLFGGLGKNILNPAVAARCFLLLSFGSVMTKYGVDAASSATPLAQMAKSDMSGVLGALLGTSSGVIGASALGLILGGLFLWITGGITWHIPVSTVGAFAIVVLVFGGHITDLTWFLGHMFAGGILMGAIFMATDPVTSPMTAPGQLIYGAVIGVIAAAFRLWGSADDTVSYAILLGNVATPLIDLVIAPKPYGYRGYREEKKPEMEEEKMETPPEKKLSVKGIVLIAAAVILCGGVVFGLTFATRDTVESNRLAVTYRDAYPAADSFTTNNDLNEKVEEVKNMTALVGLSDLSVEEAVVAKAGDQVVGGAVKVTTKGFKDNLTVAVGVSNDGTVVSVQVLSLNDTPDIGMRCGESAFTGQFIGKTAPITVGENVNAVSGATITSTAMTKAVNAAVDFWNTFGKGAAAS